MSATSRGPDWLPWSFHVIRITVIIIVVIPGALLPSVSFLVALLILSLLFYLTVFASPRDYKTQKTLADTRPVN